MKHREIIKLLADNKKVFLNNKEYLKLSNKGNLCLYDSHNKFIEKLGFYIQPIKQEHLLDDVEREYLSYVIKPFRDRIIDIRKINLDCGWEYLVIHMKEETNCLPSFKEGTMYKGMVAMKYYTLEELGL